MTFANRRQSRTLLCTSLSQRLFYLRGCFKSLPVKSPLNRKEIFGEAFLKASEDAAFLGKRRHPKTFIVFIKGLSWRAFFEAGLDERINGTKNIILFVCYERLYPGKAFETVS
ncbi:hypothetical protein GOB93_07010 [Acetobacter musti]|uniref:Transposase n=1 Tax=Acetobacter musti TaxID=864732 RepID=A0ABX0JR26_9PROT|nr:hypothetical protein [Acetobacter musti]NHN84395.1 hypothetical protein [Acetobacter musti]